MRNTVLLGAAIALVACSGGGGGGAPPPPPPAACVDGLCPSGFHCELSSNVCVQNGCNGPGDCPAGSTCTGYQCVSGPVPCASHADCAPDGLCNPATDTCQPTLSCNPLTPCPGGWDCVSFQCRRLPAGTCKRQIDCLAAGDRCVAERCVGCASTGMECTGGASTCDGAANTCKPCGSGADCPAGLLCTAEGCAECDDHADCGRFPGRPYCLKPLDTTVSAGLCGECGAGWYGCPSGQSCLMPGDVCGRTSSCWSDSDCGGAHPHCEPDRHACVQCLADAHCPSGEVCRFGLCHVTQRGDRCQDPFDLVLDPARTDVSLTLAGFGCDRESGLCYPGGADVFYRFTLAAETRISLSATASDGSAPAGLQLFSDGCADDVGARTVSSGQEWATYLPPGTWVLRVDGNEDAAYVLTARTSTPALPAGNSCVDPIPIPQSPSGASLTGSTAGLLPVSGDACSADAATRAPTAIYALDLAAPSYVELTATPLSSSFLLDLDVKDLCPAAPLHMCNGTYGRAVTRTYRPLPAGLHYVVVAAENGTSGSFRLDAVVNPWMTNDLCADAKALAFSGGVATESGSTGAHSAAATAGCFCPLAGSCGSSLAGCQGASAASQYCGNDVFYRFTTTADRRLDVSVTADGTWIPAFSVRAACGAASGAGCGIAAADVASGTVNVLPAGDWLVQVASKSATVGGPFTLQVALSDPVYPVPANDTCAAATVLAPPGALGGDTRGATDQESGTCGGSDPGAGGRDVSFRYTFPLGRGRLDLAARPVAPTAATFQPVLRVRDGCPGTQQLSCAIATAPGGTATLAPLFLAPGTTIDVSVDGAAGTAGTFSLEPTFTPSPGRDDCSTAAVLPLDLTAAGQVSASGDLRAAWQDGTCAGVQGPDLYFAVQPPNGNHTVRLTAQPSGFTAGVAYYGEQTCGTTCVGTPAPAVGAGAGQSVSLTVPAGGRTLFFVVSSVDGARGTFSVTATLDPP